jgi:hypothetical protein
LERSNVDETQKSGFLNVDPTREYRLQRELEYQALDERKFESDDCFAKWKAVIFRRHAISVPGYMGLNAIGERLIKEAEEEYKPIRAAREAARVRAEREDALPRVISKWFEERTPLYLTVGEKHPELCAGIVVKFSGFEVPNPYVLLGGSDFRRKISLSEKWAVSKNGEKICGDSFEISAAGLDTDAAEKLFGLPASDLLISK